MYMFEFINALIAFNVIESDLTDAEISIFQSLFIGQINDCVNNISADNPARFLQLPNPVLRYLRKKQPEYIRSLPF